MLIGVMAKSAEDAVVVIGCVVIAVLLAWLLATLFADAMDTSGH